VCHYLVASDRRRGTEASKIEATERAPPPFRHRRTENMEESEDLDSWLGQPPERPKEPTPDPIVDADSDVQLSDHNLTDSDAASPERTHDVITVREVVREAEEDEVELSSNDEDEDVFKVGSQRAETSNVYVEVSPFMDDYEDYEYLRGHFRVRRVVSEYKDEKFLVKLESGESDLVGSLSCLSNRSCLLCLRSVDVTYKSPSISAST
jgi:hypothetical protein